MLNLLKAFNLVLKGASVRDAWFFASWIGGGNSKLVRRFKLEKNCVVDRSTGKKFNLSIQKVVGNNLEVLRVALDEFSLYEKDKFFWVSPSHNSINLQIKLANNSSLQVVFEVYREAIYSFYSDRSFAVIDVGANIGIASTYFASMPNVENVFSYELVPSTFEIAKENILASRLDNKIELFDYGIGLSEGDFNIPLEEQGSVDASIFEVSRAAEKSLSGKTIKVHVKSAVEEFERVLASVSTKSIVLKLDCEGTEYEIIPAMAEAGLLSRFSIVMMEWHYYGPFPLMEHLVNNGFSVFNRNIPNDGGQRGMLYAIRSINAA